MSAAGWAWLAAAAALAFGLFAVSYTTYRIFVNTLYRSPKAPRTRACSDSSVPDQKRMFDEGILWAERNAGRIIDLEIENDGLRLYGQYADFGREKCAVILQGRTESLLYSYYFAEVYERLGYNVLTVDVRAHGLSDGKYITAGVCESRDLAKWIGFIRERCRIEEFVIHGICIGAATALFAQRALRREGVIRKLVFDGLFINYFEIFKNHIIERKRPVFCFVHLSFLLTRVLAGANLWRETPLRCIGELDVPALFLWSAKDPYCLPDQNRILYDACRAEGKAMRVFPDGTHSFVRFHHRDEYDRAVEAFLLGSEGE